MCAFHMARRLLLPDDAALYAEARATNINKNRAIARSQVEMGIVEQPDGTKAIPPWRVDAADIVRVTTGLNSTRRTRLQNAINAAVGVGKVVVE